MSLALAAILKPTVRRTLPALISVLDKAERHAEAAGYDPAVLIAARFSPDMLPLSAQIAIASDLAARGAARLAGQEPPSTDTPMASFTDLRARVQAALYTVEAQDDAALNAGADRMVTFPTGLDMTMTLTGQGYLLHFLLPNIYFHVTTAYDLLRHNGVPLGKRDFIGEIPQTAAA